MKSHIWGGGGGKARRLNKLKIKGGCGREFLWLKFYNDGFSGHRSRREAEWEFMIKFVLFLGTCFVLGGLAVASNPSPYYGVVGLVVASIAGCG